MGRRPHITAEEEALMVFMAGQRFQAVQIARALARDERAIRRHLKTLGVKLSRHNIPFGGDRLLKLLQRHHGDFYVRYTHWYLSPQGG